MNQTDLAGQASPIIQAVAEAPAAMPANLTPWRMFAEADPFVQAVMVVLALASILTWAIWLSKSTELAGAKRALKGDLERLNGAASIADLSKLDHGPAAAMVEAARSELAHAGSAEGVKERLATRLERVEVAAGQKMLRGTNILATIASAGPFVGLFGTVWGIMNAFIGIAQTQTTSLAVVAPGIAEALLATALGLVAAIPAVVIFNAFARSVSDYRRMVGDAAAGVAVLTSRVLDNRAR